MDGLQNEFIREAREEIKPKLGMEFISEDAAYEFYNAYGRWCGFSIRKSKMRKLTSGDISMRIFTCSKEGVRSKKWIDKTDRKRKAKMLTRCGCLARIKVNRKKGVAKWVLTEFNEMHNHKLMTPSKSHYLMSQKSVLGSHLDVMEDLQGVDAGIARTFNYLTNEANGRDCAGYEEKDSQNAFRRKRFEHYGHSAQLLLKFFQQKSKEDPFFCYEIQVDDDCRLTSCFWVDGTSKTDYDAFGDVVCFDTSYKTNEFDMPFGSFVGVNHHKQSILLGAGLLFGESANDFKWLFQTWLDAMGGRAPRVIITDQDPTIASVVAEVFPNTAHHLSIWHINQKVPEHLGSVFQKYESFSIAWTSCVHKSEEIEEFETSWSKMIEDFDLHDNTWLLYMYDIRKMWIRAYTNCIFTAGMTTTGRSKSVNAIFDCFVNHTTSLLEFGTGYDSALQKHRREELRADFETSNGKPVLKTIYPMEAQMASTYTKEIFNSFQKELEQSQYLAAQLVETEGVLDKYRVSHHLPDRKVRIVVWNKEKELAHCPCLLFESFGVICKHILAMFKIARVMSIPSNHILSRWKSNAKDKWSQSSYSTVADLQTSPMLRQNVLSRKLVYVLNQSTSHFEAFKVAEAGIEKIVEAIQDLRLEEENASVGQMPVSHSRAIKNKLKWIG